MAKRSVVAAALVVLVATSLLVAYQYRRTAGQWSADGSIYARLALERRGVARADARREVDAFMLRTSDATNPESRGFYGGRAPDHFVRQFVLFRGRPLYPMLAAVLIPRFGLDALRVVSALAAIAAAFAAFTLLLAVAPPWIAALGALGFVAAPPVRDLAAAPLTDALALAAWCAVLAATAHALRLPARPRMVALVAVATVATLVLAFTRPAIYLPLAAAAGALLTVPAARRRELVPLGAGIGIACAAAIAYTLAAHAPGIGEQLRWEYDWARETGTTASAPVAWYLAALMHGVFVAAASVAYDGGWLLGAAFAAFGYARGSARRWRTFAVVAALGATPALFANPVDVIRTFVVPLVPLALLGIGSSLALSAGVRTIGVNGDGAPPAAQRFEDAIEQHRR